MKNCAIGNSNQHCRYFDAAKVGYVIPKELFGKDTNAKTKKGVALGWSTLIIYLAPAKQNIFGKNLCSSATEGCTKSCLFSAGRGRMKPVEKARMNKAEYFLSDRSGFMQQAYKEIDSAYKNSLKKGIPIAVRMNGTSDIPWENISVEAPNGVKYRNLMEAFPQVQFYDYTKIYSRLGNTPKNYHLTFSRAETMKNKMESKEALKRGFQVAAVFAIKKGEDLPKTYDGYKVVDGDEHDLTFLRPQGVILGLRAKGDALKDKSGFVIQLNKSIGNSAPFDANKVDLNSISRELLIKWLVWNDKNGIYTDSDSIAEGMQPLTKQEAIELIKGQKIGGVKKEFLVTDKSGRSAKPYKMDIDHIKKHFDLDDMDYNTEQTLRNFLEESYIGDVWNTADLKIKCIGIKEKKIGTMTRFKKGSKAAKDYMAKLRAMKSDSSGGTLQGLDFVNKRGSTTYLHYSRKPKKGVRKKAAPKKSASRKTRTQKNTLLPLSYLLLDDTYTLGKSGKTIYQLGYKVPNRNAYYAYTLTGKKVIHKGTTKVNLIDERGISGYVHTKKRGTKTIVKYSRVNGVETKSKSHSDYNSPEVNIQIGLTKDSMNTIAHHMGVLAASNAHLLKLKTQLAFAATASDKARIRRHIESVKNHIRNTKKQIQLAKKSIK